MTGIKICGLFRECDIDFVNEAKPDYIGFILDFPKSHRNITPEFAKKLKDRLLPGIKAVGVFVDRDIEFVAESARMIGLDVIQLHGNEDDAYISKLRNILSLHRDQGGERIRIWKAFKVRNEQDLEAARKSTADEILLDNGYGTGKVFDWSLAGRFDRDFLLAGGLTTENLGEAIRTLKPKLVDISSGVETDRQKDREKILKAVRIVRDTES